MTTFHRIYPKKRRKPQKSEEALRRAKHRRATKRIAQGRVKRAVAKWPEHKELERIKANPRKKNLIYYLPKANGKSPHDEDNLNE